ncbi:MAG: putative transcriptional regulatory protein TcrX [Candidatus Omnitrophica bacterium]|nr:putative transcriptional regulatory protein TcrX [Candidatus Omnitrophota bacterium]
MRILIVDDEPDMVSMVGEWLELRGYQVDRTADSVRALEMLKAVRYDLAFLDLSMPEITGLELLDYIKKNSPETRAVMVSAYPYPLVEDLLAQAVGIDDYIAKPFRFEEIERIVSKYKDGTPTQQKGA